jgi:ABC-type sugar transport system ATPase subunit
MEIRIKNLTKIFPGDPKKHIRDTVAVKDLDFVVPDGKLVGLLGPSGCGKSTTLYMISGLLKPTSGEVWFGDQEVTNLSPEKRGIGLGFPKLRSLSAYDDLQEHRIPAHEPQSRGSDVDVLRFQDDLCLRDESR